ncbi:MAG: class I tRNA ligase family protein, partial [Methanomassiliicoccaceae archaeon]|nr:class I tRNA ligase family protein [Methanomassiliicoccaceae archaeon]
PKGQKMSKSLGNVIEPLEIINSIGADSLRLYMIKANAPWEDTAFQKDGPKNARKVLNTYWNVVNFASTYMNIDNYDPTSHTLESVRAHLRDEDKWMLSRTEKVKKAVTQGMETRELHKVARALEDYIMEDLSRWYVRLVRDRSWSEGSDAFDDKMASYFVLHHAIMNTALLLAPLTPHISEEIYQHMGGTKPSVHMEDWVTYDESLFDDGLERSMYLIQNIIEVVAAERAKMGSKLRWPLKQIFIESDDANLIAVFEEVLKQQGNIKEIRYTASDSDVKGLEAAEFDGGKIFIDFSVTPEIEAEGYARELIRRIQQMRKDMKLNVEQYINCEVSAEPRLVELFGGWAEHISSEVRAKSLVFTESPGGDEVKTWDVTGKDIVIGISSAEQ